MQHRLTTTVTATFTAVATALAVIAGVSGCAATPSPSAAGPDATVTTSAAATTTAAGHPTGHPAATGTAATRTEDSSAAPTSTAPARHTASASARPKSSAQASATASPGSVITPAWTTDASTTRPHFDTPEAAMRYLVDAWNANDLTKLKHVTEPNARALLLGMKREAVNLRLDSCEKRQGGDGDYLCHFTHDYPSWVPASDREGTHGSAELIAAPSASVGWYMFQYEGCG